MKAKLMSIAAIALLTTFDADAQVEKNTWLLGGGVSHNQFTDEDVKTLEINDIKTTNRNETLIAFSAGKAFSKNNILGLSVGNSLFNSVSQLKLEEGLVIQEEKSSLWTAGVFHRIYLPLSGSFYLFGQTNLSYAYGKTSADGRRSTIDLSVTPGLAYAISRRMHAELSLPRLFSIGHTRLKEGPFSSSQFSATANVTHHPAENIGIGFSFLIP